MSPPIDAHVNQPPPIQVEITQQNGVTVSPDNPKKTPISTSNKQILSSQKYVQAPSISTPTNKTVTIAKATKTPTQIGTVGSITIKREYEREKLAILLDFQTNFTLDKSAVNPVDTFVYLNGVQQEYAVDYLISGTSFTWNSAVYLETDDVLEVYYSTL